MYLFFSNVFSVSSYPADDDTQGDDSRLPNIPPEIITPPTTYVLARDESVTLHCDVKNSGKVNV